MRIDDRVLELPVEDGARILVRGLLAEAVDAAGALAGGADAGEALHDFRVAVRRLRSALRAYRPWLGEATRRPERRALKRLARATGAARDAEVQLGWLEARRGEVWSPARRPGHEAAVAWFEARRRDAPDPARTARRFRRLGRKLRRRLRGGRTRRRADAEPLGPALAGLVLAQVAELSGRLAAVRDAADVEGAHRARIAAKRLRYLLEPLRGSARADASAVVGELKALQDVLGDLHDAHLLAAALGDALAEAAAARARRVHAAALATGDRDALRAGLRGSPRPGLLALVRLVAARRDARYAGLVRAWREGAPEALAARVRTLAGALAPGAAAAGDGAAPARPAPTRPRRGSAGDGRPSRGP